MGTKYPPHPYAFQVIPGLEALAVEEWELRTGETLKPRILPGGHRDSTVLVSSCGGENVFALRTVEDVFSIVGKVDAIPAGRAGLASVERAVSRPDRLAAGLSHMRSRPPRSFERRVPYRLVARDDGSADFSRHAILRHAHRALGRLERPRWEHAGEGAPVELWLLLSRRTFLCLLRLTDRTFRHRDYKTAHLPGSLRPTVAAAMVLVTEPKPGDRFVDPLCGGGTVAIERALWGPARQVIAGDLDSRALGFCRENSSSLETPPDWVRWDAGRLPLPDYAADKVATNLPFGGKHGAEPNIRELYRRVCTEVGRVLRPGGKAVFLTAQKRTLGRFLNEETHLRFERSTEVRILGKRAFLVKAWKR